MFCSKSRGAFLNEYLISIDTQDGPISGFIDAEAVEETESGANYIWGIVHRDRGRDSNRWFTWLVLHNHRNRSFLPSHVGACLRDPLPELSFARAVEEGEIEFDPPLEEAQWGEASVDLRLGYQFTTLVTQDRVTISVADGLGALAQSNLWNTDDLREPDKHGRARFHEIHKGDFVLAQTYESIRVPRNMIARVEGRSTYARVGLSMHQTAPWIQPGWSGPIILELMNNGPLTIKVDADQRSAMSTHLLQTHERSPRRACLWREGAGHLPRSETPAQAQGTIAASCIQ